ncbi:posterior protein-like [Xenopus tropicalis]|uniref:Posterior protein-like n=1 Tax=Xenopus tropicalis TaxID=8364 RepID=A0A8J1IXX1_XENTR|nr:posterior protein-like [Xenopus tropicalis]
MECCDMNAKTVECKCSVKPEDLLLYRIGQLLAQCNEANQQIEKQSFSLFKREEKMANIMKMLDLMSKEADNAQYVHNVKLLKNGDTLCSSCQINLQHIETLKEDSDARREADGVIRAKTPAQNSSVSPAANTESPTVSSKSADELSNSGAHKYSLHWWCAQCGHSFSFTEISALEAHKDMCRNGIGNTLEHPAAESRETVQYLMKMKKEFAPFDPRIDIVANVSAYEATCTKYNLEEKEACLMLKMWLPQNLYCRLRKPVAEPNWFLAAQWANKNDRLKQFLQLNTQEKGLSSENLNEFNVTVKDNPWVFASTFEQIYQRETGDYSCNFNHMGTILMKKIHCLDIATNMLVKKTDTLQEVTQKIDEYNRDPQDPWNIRPLHSPKFQKQLLPKSPKANVKKAAKALPEDAAKCYYCRKPGHLKVNCYKYRMAKNALLKPTPSATAKPSLETAKECAYESLRTKFQTIQINKTEEQNNPPIEEKLLIEF